MVPTKMVLDALASFRREQRRRGSFVAFESFGMAPEGVSDEEKMPPIPIAQLAEEEVQPHCDTLAERERPVQRFRHQPRGFLARQHRVSLSGLETHVMNFEASPQVTTSAMQHHPEVSRRNV
jgi:hypothetical protein